MACCGLDKSAPAVTVRLEILPAGETENAKLQLQRRLEGVKTTTETLKLGVLAVPRINWNCHSY